MTEADQVRDALRFLSPEDRDDWVRIGMAIKAGLGDSLGWAVWSEWSALSDRYRERDARAVWRSIKEGGGIRLGTLFALAREAGWRPGGDFVAPRRDPAEERRRREREAAEQRRRDQRAERAAREAVALLARASYEEHPYLESKGFVPKSSPFGPGQSRRGRGMVLDGALLIPMRHSKTGEVVGVQKIDPDGGKLFHPPGVRASGAILRMGNQRRPKLTWWVEGYATGLSVVAALEGMYRREDQVVVCFSSGNIPKVCRRGGIVLADHDWWRCTNRDCPYTWDYEAETCKRCGSRAVRPAGEKAALQTGLIWWMPPDAGTDCNDFARQAGLPVFRGVLRDLARRALEQQADRRKAFVRR